MGINSIHCINPGQTCHDVFIISPGVYKATDDFVPKGDGKKVCKLVCHDGWLVMLDTWVRGSVVGCLLQSGVE